jgi:prevent-host-death family protein
MSRWQLQEAKQQFSRLVEQARSDGAQIVTRNGKEVAVVLGIEEYRKLTDSGKDFKKFLLEGPLVDELPIVRSKELPREIDLS